jgi:hypothetical protein
LESIASDELAFATKNSGYDRFYAYRLAYCGGIRVSRKASCGRQRAEDKERLRERVLVDEKGTTVSPEVGGRHPYIHATVDAKTMWFHHNKHGFHASLSSARSAHSNVSYTSHPHSKDVNNSTGTYSDAIDHSETDHEIVNLPVRMTNLETEMKDCKTEIKDFKTEMKDFKTEMFHKFDLFAVKLGSNLEKRLSTYAKDQQKEFSQFYSRCLLAVSLTPYIIYQFLTRSRS